MNRRSERVAATPRRERRRAGSRPAPRREAEASRLSRVLGNAAHGELIRGMVESDELAAVRALVAESWPHLARVLGPQELGRIGRVLVAEAHNRELDERKSALKRRLRAEFGPSWWARSDSNDAMARLDRRRVAMDRQSYVLDVSMEFLLDPRILRVQDHNVLAESRFRQWLWNELREVPAQLTIGTSTGEDLALALYWGPEGRAGTRWPVGREGGLVGFDELMEIPSLRRAYKRKVRRGPEVLYLKTYADQLMDSIEWREIHTEGLYERVTAQPFVHHSAFWTRGRGVEYPPGTEIFQPAREALHAAELDLIHGHVEAAALRLQRCEEAFMAASKEVADYEAGMFKGVGRALTALHVAKSAGKFAGAVLTGRGPLAAGNLIRGAITSGLGAGGVSLAQELAQQSSAMVQGVQGEADVGGALLRSGKEALVTSVGVWTGMHASRFAHQLFRPFALRVPMPDFVRRHLPEMLGGAAAAPLGTAAEVGLNRATGEGRVPGSVGEFADMAVDDILTGALLQVGLSPVLGRVKGASLGLQVPEGKLYARGPRDVVTLYHGTPRSQVSKLEAGIDVAKNQYPHDQGRGFYATEERIGADEYARSRGAQYDEPGAVAEVHVRLDDLGNIVDVRHGGAHRAAWEAFLDSPFVDLPHYKMSWRERLLGPRGMEARGEAFEQFLAKNFPDADTIFGPLGDDFSYGITGGATTQVTIRGKAVAALLDRLGLKWMAPRPKAGAKEAGSKP